MRPDDKQRFGIAMGIMGEAFQKKPSESMTEIYWKILQDMTIEDFEGASLSIINTRKITGTFPLVAEIREAAQTSTEPLEIRIAIGWDKLKYALHRHGHYDSVQFDDPIIHRIVDSWGGWMELDWETKEDKWKRKEFVELYRAYSQANLPEPQGHLVGFHEHSNSLRGFADFIPPPVLISGRTGAFVSRVLPKAKPPRQIESNGSAHGGGQNKQPLLEKDAEELPQKGNKEARSRGTAQQGSRRNGQPEEEVLGEDLLFDTGLQGRFLSGEMSLNHGG
jgi:hypothetical protein